MRDPSEDLSLSEVLVEEVMGSICTVNNAKSSGADGIYPMAVEESKHQITELQGLNAH